MKTIFNSNKPRKREYEVEGIYPLDNKDLIDNFPTLTRFVCITFPIVGLGYSIYFSTLNHKKRVYQSLLTTMVGFCAYYCWVVLGGSMEFKQTLMDQNYPPIQMISNFVFGYGNLVFQSFLHYDLKLEFLLTNPLIFIFGVATVICFLYFDSLVRRIVGVIA